jgi:pimeloyl-ACP methyl ester carboxylesterase
MASILPKSLTFLLVHGAFHGGWCWRHVADRLIRAGARVHAPTMTGLGERAHLLTRDVGLATFIDDVIGVIEAEELNDVILVGHSFGGIVISGVVDRMPERIRRSVYLDALVPLSGQSAISLLPPETAAMRIRAAQESSAGLSIPVPTGDIFDLPPGLGRDWVARRITPHPLASYTDSVSLNGPPGNGRPRSYIRCTDPIYPAVAPSYERIRTEAGWTLADIATGHDAMVSAPDALADLLLELANA